MSKKTLDLIQKSILHPDTMPCGHPLEQDDDLLLGTAHIAWCTEVERVQGELAALHGHDEANPMSCGHPRGCIAQDEEGTAICAWCEEVARLRDVVQLVERLQATVNQTIARTEQWKTLWGIMRDAWDAALTEAQRLQGEIDRLWGDDGHPHESGDECIGCERIATDWGFPYCNQCLLEHQLAFAEETTTMAQSEMVRLREELEQAAAREAALVEAANTLVQRLAAMNLEKPNAIAVGNALAYGPEVTALQDALENIIDEEMNDKLG